MPTSVALGSHFEEFVKEQVRAGRFNNSSEVVRAGLRLLEDQEQLTALKLRELRAAVDAGVRSGPGKKADVFFDELRQKYRSSTAKPIKQRKDGT